eukprot:403338695
MVTDTVVLLNQKIHEGKRILVEDCSSSLMDVDFGIYPYTDSFNTTTGAVCTGLGVPEEAIETTIGVMSVASIIRQSFLNRILTFPSSVPPEDPAYESMKRKLSQDYDLTPDLYNFGWLDLNPIRHAHMLNHLSSIYLTGLDLFDELDEIKICKGYKIGETEVEGIHPTLIDDFAKLSPIYKTLKGWKQNIQELEKFDDLPTNCQSLIMEIEKRTKVQIKYVSVNNDEDEGLLRIMR